MHMAVSGDLPTWMQDQVIKEYRPLSVPRAQPGGVSQPVTTN